MQYYISRALQLCAYVLLFLIYNDTLLENRDFLIPHIFKITVQREISMCDLYIAEIYGHGAGPSSFVFKERM